MALPPKMPELQLLLELLNRFPEVPKTTVMKIMKTFDNDTEKCIHALEQESQKSHVTTPLDQNNSSLDQNNTLNHADGGKSGVQSYFTVNNNNNLSKFTTGISTTTPRYQEVPVRHEQSTPSHISTVRRNLGPPAVPAKPFLVIDPMNQGAPDISFSSAGPSDFRAFVDGSPRTPSEIPNIRCSSTPLKGIGGGGVGKPEVRRPVKVLNVQGTSSFSGGTVTTLSPPSTANVTPAFSQFRVLLKDGGGVCSTPSPPSSPPNSRHPVPAHIPETAAVHTSSIFINSPVNTRRTNNIQEQTSYLPSAQGGETGSSMFGSESAVSKSVSGGGVRSGQPLNVSLSSHAHVPGNSSGNVISYASPFGIRGNQDMGPSNISYPVSKIAHEFNHLGISYPQPASSTSPLPPGASPSVVSGLINFPSYGTRLPQLQHQQSSGSSTSRSNSMDSEHSEYDSLSQPPPLPLRTFGGKKPVISPASSHSSLSSESSLRDRDSSSVPRQRSGSMQEEAAYSQALLGHQRQRKDQLKEDINSKRLQLERLRREVSSMEKSKLEKTIVRKTFPAVEDIASLCERNRRLQTDIQMYLNEIDMYKNGQTPFSILDPIRQQNFYSNMPTGPNDLTYTRPPHRPSSPPVLPPPRPPARPLQNRPNPPMHRVNSDDLSQQVPPPSNSQITSGGGSGDSEEGEHWNCAACTFRNHPALTKCEMCEMPRLVPGRDLHHHHGDPAGSLGLGLAGSVSMPHLHMVGRSHCPHPQGVGQEMCYCHNVNCRQKLHKL